MKLKTGIAAFTGVALTGVVTAVLCSQSGSNQFGPELAEQACIEMYIPDRLKAPATARFSDIETTRFTTDVWSVTVNVDSENGFGALVRTAFVCRTRVVDGLTELVDIQEVAK